MPQMYQTCWLNLFIIFSLTFIMTIMNYYLIISKYNYKSIKHLNNKKMYINWVW